ncbi:hypothetical protein [Pseudoalteromonas sp. T1lg10]|uniref:hypothetical protein n=1 Tax=Pseudoalteromonas sp. T1lg10 TaxID=2077093 RepID=UPI000CF659AF|nr:hypothetical protein [Pseudoalteromonas sp. T1lg10]
MRELNVNEIEEVNGGCAEHCWGDFSSEDFSSAISAGSLLGARGALVAGAVYLAAVAWFDLK